MTTQTTARFTLLVRRVGAYLLDIALLFLVLAPLTLVAQPFLNVDPSSGVQVWLAALLHFSLPAWIYFIWSDASKAGATFGKRLMDVRVVNATSTRLGLGQAALRTAVKLIPWELAHLVFAFSSNATNINVAQLVLLGVSNGLLLVYIGILLKTVGRKSVHDLVAKTEVQLQ